MILLGGLGSIIGFRVFFCISACDSPELELNCMQNRPEAQVMTTTHGRATRRSLRRECAIVLYTDDFFELVRYHSHIMIVTIY